jgi:hypothetical protein
MANLEIWNDIPNYEGLYQVSNLGRVKSLDKSWYQFNPQRGGNVLMKRKSKIIKPQPNGNGYLQAYLVKDKTKKKFYIHRLVKMTFDKLSFLDIDHINGLRSDNRLENLRYCTRHENMTFDNVKRKNKRISSFIGVNFSGGKWRSVFNLNKKRYWLGEFDNEIDAHLAYKNKIKEISLT